MVGEALKEKIEITDLNYVIDKSVEHYYRWPKTSLQAWALGHSYDGDTLKIMRSNYPDMVLFVEKPIQRFKTDKPYPFGY